MPPSAITIYVNRSVCGARVPHCGTRGVRACLRAAGQAPRAGLLLEEVGVRHVEQHSRLRSPDELAALQQTTAAARSLGGVSDCARKSGSL